MAEAIHIPRINNNDDEVKLVGLAVGVGGRVTKGQIIAQIETDKAVVDVEAIADGYVLAVFGAVNDVVNVGSVLIWLGNTKDDAIPELAKPNDAPRPLGSAPTAKARALLKEYGLDAAVVPASGERLNVDDIERYMATNGKPLPLGAKGTQVGDLLPDLAGELKPLKSEDRGMLSTVLWHRDVAVPGYIEITYDPAPWDAYASEFGRRQGLLLSPLLPLMAWRLVELARDNARLNSTIVGTKRYEYKEVNLGSTIQVGDVLYLAVVRDSARLGEFGFVSAMVDLQRRAAGHKLSPQETQGTTIGFSSMARWKVARHVPILSPQTALMVAHTSGSDGVAVLGATYDHRVMNGSDVASMLRKLSNPGKSS
jgi:pyruvate dehydrogenase E2 component (dihydrolipoamide acetyltransferase)